VKGKNVSVQFKRKIMCLRVFAFLELRMLPSAHFPLHLSLLPLLVKSQLAISGSPLSCRRRLRHLTLGREVGERIFCRNR
jgi:hypothetical protein